MSVSRLSKQSIQVGFPKQQTIWDQSTQTAAMDAISSVTLTSSQSRVEFNNIPQTYTHLQIRAVTRSDSSAGSSTVSYGASGYIYFNGDIGTNYNEHYLYGDGSSAGTGVIGAYTNLLISDLGGPYATQTANTFSSSIIDILDYTNTNKAKTVRVLNGQDRNGYGRSLLQSGFWFATPAAINTITIFVGDSSTFSIGTTFSLYGIK